MDGGVLGLADRPGQVDHAVADGEGRRTRRDLAAPRDDDLRLEGLAAVARATNGQHAFVVGPRGVDGAVRSDGDIEAAVVPDFGVESTLALPRDGLGEVLRCLEGAAAVD